MSCIIFLKGIKIDDYRNIEDQFNDMLLQDVLISDYKVETNVKYDTIYPIFESMELWPKSNNIRCWNCDFTFTSIPIFVPMSIKPNGDIWNISVLGNFCSFNCTCRYIIDFLHEDLLNNLIKLYYIFYNKKVYKIEPTQRRYIMIKYGGYMSDEQYISQIKRLSLKIQQEDNIKKTYIQKYDFCHDSSSSDDES